MTGRVAFHGRVQFLESLGEFVLVDQLMPRGIGPDRCAVEDGFLGGGEPFGDGLSDCLGVHVEDWLRQPVPKGVQGGPARLNPLTEPSQCLAVSHIASPFCWRQTALKGLVQDDLEHEVRVVGEGPDPKVSCLQAGSIQTVDESINGAGGVIDGQLGIPLFPQRGARRGGRGGESAFLLRRVRLASSSWPPCVTTVKTVAHHVRFAKTRGGHFFCQVAYPLQKAGRSPKGGEIPQRNWDELATRTSELFITARRGF